jgi:hypothetical protein
VSTKLKKKAGVYMRYAPVEVELFNSLTAMDAHERPLFFELCSIVVFWQIFVRW